MHRPPKAGRLAIAGLLLVPFLALVLLPGPSARAASAGVTFAGGSGSVNPSVTAFPGTHSWSAGINGPWLGALANGTSAFLPFSCGLMWNTLGVENLAVGLGSGTASCTSPPHGWMSNVSVVRVGTLVVFAFTPSGIDSLIGTAVCAMLPLPVLNGPPWAPLSTFTLTCGAAGASVVP